MDDVKEMSEETKQLMAQANKARTAYRAGLISREECNSQVLPYALHFNVKAKEIAKRFGMRPPKPFSITSYLR